MMVYKLWIDYSHLQREGKEQLFTCQSSKWGALGSPSTTDRGYCHRVSWTLNVEVR